MDPLQPYLLPLEVLSSFYPAQEEAAIFPPVDWANQSQLVVDQFDNETLTYAEPIPPQINGTSHFEPVAQADTAMFDITESSFETEIRPNTSMAPPTRVRKRKAPTLRDSDWEPYKDRIVQLHITQDRPLPEVKKIMEEETGFTAELRQYRLRVSKWGLDKNIKTREMKAIVRKRQERKLIDKNKGEFEFQVRGFDVDPSKIDRWMKRNQVSENLIYAPSPAASTPSAVNCRTISERGTPAPSLPFSPQSPFTQPNSPYVDQVNTPKPLVSWPSPSISEKIGVQNAKFTGQSPAPIHRSLPGVLPDISPEWNWYESSIVPLPIGTGNRESASMPIRYRQKEEEELRKKLAIMGNSYEIEHPERLATVLNLTTLLQEQGRYGTARKMLQVLIEDLKKVGRENGVEIMEVHQNLARVLIRQGFYNIAEKLSKQAFQFMQDTLGKDHPKTLHAMCALADAYYAQDRLQEAESLRKEHLEACNKVFPAGHIFTIGSTMTLATIYGKQGRLEEAEWLKVRVIELLKNNHGGDNILAVTATTNLAVTLCKQGKLEDAERLQLQTLERSRRLLGEEHPDTLLLMANLACLYKDQGRESEAVGLMGKVVQLRCRILGSQHPQTVSAEERLRSWKATREMNISPIY